MGRTFYPGFQGLRGVAALLVFCCHYYSMAVPFRAAVWGSVGVDLFFVLSGFLITGILRESRALPDHFRRFYRNRVYRIFPVFYGIWLALFVLSPWLRPVWTAHLLSMPLYLGNFFEMGQVGRNGTVFLRVGHGNTTLLMGHLWSLTVEEHFYLVWPLIVWLVPSRRKLFYLASVMVLLTVLLRVYLVLHLSQARLDAGLIYFSSFTRLDSILIGAMLSCWVPGTTLTLRRKVAPWLAGIPLVLLFAGQMLLPGTPDAAGYDWRVQTYGFTLIATAAAGVLLSAMDAESLLYRVVTVKPLMSLGLISYSFYMLHFIPYHIWDGYMVKARHYHLQLALLLLIFAVTYAAAALSYRFVELPFLRLKDRGAQAFRQKPDGALTSIGTIP